MTAAPTTREPLGDVRELRLALVCYGGVSLAIYMHGVTKEIHKLVLASAAYDRDQRSHPFPPGSTEAVYWDLLRRMHRGQIGAGPRGVRTRVVVDIISGTSAGGINGICLAKALALNRSQDALKTLWMDKGDIRKLAAGARGIPLALKAPWLVMRSIVGSKVLRRPLAPLRGNEMCQWLHGAFEEMDRAPALPGAASLMPRDHSLDLFVPVTDFGGYARELPIDEPRVVRDRTHRHVLEFRHESPERTDLGPAANHALAFAARATSSFPGAFPPVTFETYQGSFAVAPRLREVCANQFGIYDVNDADPERSAFIDGGVLDNYPFGLAIAAIRTKPAATQVDRRLLYIEPDPTADVEAARRAPGETRAAPSWLGTIWGGLSTIPRAEPILDDLARLYERNQLVARIRDIIETSFDAIRAHTRQTLARELGAPELAALSRTLPPDRLLRLRSALEDDAATASGFGHATYIRLRIRLVLESYADAVARALKFPAGSSPALFVRNVIREWAQSRGLLDKDPSASPAQRRFLAGVDLGYHDRRLRFVIAAFSWWYRDVGKPGYPTRAELDRVKALLYGHLERLGQLVADLGKHADAIAALNRAFERDATRRAARNQAAREYAERHAEELDRLREVVERRVLAAVAAGEARLYDQLIELSATWAPGVKTDVLVRYLGFPFWDILVYSVQAVADVNERDHVEVLRVSPLDAKLLEPNPGAKLKGTGLFHFAAFFDRGYRENDYLWGRLDAAERLITLMLDDPERPGIEGANPAECRKAFEAILADERSLVTIERLREGLRQRAAELG